MAQFASAFDTLRWRDGRLEMIDQRVLPHEIVYLAYDDAAGVAQGIRDMVVRGAPAIGCAAAYGVALEARRIRARSPHDFAIELNAAFELLAQSRPTAVNLAESMARMSAALDAAAAAPAATASSVVAALVDAADAYLAADVAANVALGDAGAAAEVGIRERDEVLQQDEAGRRHRPKRDAGAAADIRRHGEVRESVAVHIARCHEGAA